MALGFQRQGIFGRRNPLEPMAPQVMPQPEAMPIGVKEMTKKPGFFQKGGFGQYALAALSDFGARLNDRDQNMLGSMMAFNQKKQMEAEEARLKALEPIKLGNSIIRPDGKGGYTQVYSEPKDAPQPTEFERILAASGLPPEQQLQLMQDYARNRANPVQGVPFTDEQGNSGIQFIRPGQMQGAQQGLIPIGGTLPPKGGSGGNVTGGFR